MWRRSVFVFKEYFRGPTKKVIMPKMTNKPLNVCDRCILIRAPEIVQFPNGHGEHRSFGAHTMRQGGRLGEWATGFGPWHLG